MATTKSLSAVLILCCAALLLSPLSSVEASCSLGPHADGAGRASAADPDTYSDVCIGRLREQGSVWFPVEILFESCRVRWIRLPSIPIF